MVVEVTLDHEVEEEEATPDHEEEEAHVHEVEEAAKEDIAESDTKKN